MGKDEEGEALISTAVSQGAVIGTSLQLDNGYVIINGDKKYRCTDIKHHVREIKNTYLLITTDCDAYIFTKKKGLGGLFGLSSSIDDFLTHIDEHVEIAEKQIRQEKRIAYLENLLDEFKTGTYTLYDDDVPEGYLLKKNELIAFYQTGVEFKQVKTKRVAVASGTSIRIAKGVSWRIGGAAPIEQDVLAHVDTGRLILTNQKLSFMGDNKSVNIPINKIVDVTVYSDAFEVSKDSVMKKYVFMTDSGNVWAEGIKAMNRLSNQ